MKGKLLKFGSDGVVPVPLENKYIYVPDNDTYGNQIVVPFDKYNTAKDIMDSAEEVDKAELLEFINKSFKSILEITKNKINKNHDN